MPLPTQQQGSFVPDRPNKPPRKPRKPSPPSYTPSYSSKPGNPPQRSTSATASTRGTHTGAVRQAFTQHVAATKSYKPPRVNAKNYFNTTGIGDFLRNVIGKLPQDMDLQYYLNDTLESRYSNENIKRDTRFETRTQRSRDYHNQIIEDAKEGDFTPQSEWRDFKLGPRQTPTDKMLRRDYERRVSQPGVSAQDAADMGYTLGINRDASREETEDRARLRQDFREGKAYAIDEVNKSYDYHNGETSWLAQTVDELGGLAKGVKRTNRKVQKSFPTVDINARPDLQVKAWKDFRLEQEAAERAEAAETSSSTPGVLTNPFNILFHQEEKAKAPATRVMGPPIQQIVDKASRVIYGQAAGAEAFFALNDQKGGDEDRGFVNKVLAASPFVAPATFAFGENPADVVDDLSPSGIAKVAGATAEGFTRGGLGIQQNPVTFGHVIAANARDNPDQTIHDNKAFQIGMGLGLDLTMDLSNYVGVGMATKPLRLARATRLATAEKDVKNVTKSVDAAVRKLELEETQVVKAKANRTQAKKLKTWDAKQEQMYQMNKKNVKKARKKVEELNAKKTQVERDLEAHQGVPPEEAEVLKDVEEFLGRPHDPDGDTPISKVDAVDIVTGGAGIQGIRRVQSLGERIEQTQRLRAGQKVLNEQIEAREVEVTKPDAVKYQKQKDRYKRQRDRAMARFSMESAVDSLRGFLSREIGRGNRRVEELDGFTDMLQTEASLKATRNMEADLQRQWELEQTFEKNYGLDINKEQPFIGKDQEMKIDPEWVAKVKRKLPSEMHEKFDEEVGKLQSHYQTYRHPSEHFGIEHSYQIPPEEFDKLAREVRYNLRLKPGGVKHYAPGRTFSADQDTSRALHKQIEALRKKLGKQEIGSPDAAKTLARIRKYESKKARVDKRKDRIYSATMIRAMKDYIARGAGETVYKDAHRAKALMQFREAALAALGKNAEDIKGNGYFDTADPETTVYFPEEARGEAGLDPTTNPEALDEYNVDVADLATGGEVRNYDDYVSPEGDFDPGVIIDANPNELKRMVNYANRQLDQMNTVDPKTGKIQGFSTMERLLLKDEAPESLVDNGELNVDRMNELVHWDPDNRELAIRENGTPEENVFAQEVLDVVNENVDEAFDNWKDAFTRTREAEREDAVKAIIDEEIGSVTNPYAHMVEDVGGRSGGRMIQKAYVMHDGVRVHEQSAATNKLVNEEDTLRSQRFDAVEKTLGRKVYADEGDTLPDLQKLYRDNYEGDDRLLRNFFADFVEFRNYLREEGMITPDSFEEFAKWFRAKSNVGARDEAKRISQAQNLAFGRTFREQHGLRRLEAKNRAAVGRNETLKYSGEGGEGRGYDIEKPQFVAAFTQSHHTMRYLFDNYKKGDISMARARGLSGKNADAKRRAAQAEDPDEFWNSYWYEQWENFHRLSRNEQKHALDRIWEQNHTRRSIHDEGPAGLRGNAEAIKAREQEILADEKFQAKHHTNPSTQTMDKKRVALSKHHWTRAIKMVNENKLWKSSYDETLAIKSVNDESTPEDLLEALRHKHGEERAAAVKADLEAANDPAAVGRAKRTARRNQQNLTALKAKHKEELAAYKEAVKTAREAKVLLKQRIEEDVVLRAINMPPQEMGGALTLNALGKEFQIPGSQQIIHGLAKATDSVGLTRGAKQLYASAFKPPSAYISEQDLRHGMAQYEGHTPQIIALTVKDLEKKLGHIPQVEREKIFDLIKRRQGMKSYKGDREHYKAVYRELDRMLPFFKRQERAHPDDEFPLTVKEISARLPRPFAIRFKGQTVVDQTFQTPADLLNVMMHGKFKKSKQHPDGHYTAEEMARFNDPFDMIWSTRVAIEGALAQKALMKTVNGFGIKRQYRVRPDGRAIKTKNTRTEDGDLIELLMDKYGWKPVKELGNTHLFPPEAADEVARVVDSFNPRNIEGIEEMMDKVIRIWKTSATIYNPGYWTRNLMGEVWAAWIGGVNTPGPYWRASKVMEYVHRGGGKSDPALTKQHPLAEPATASVVKAGKRIGARLNGGRRSPGGLDMTEEEVWRAFNESGASTGFINTDLARNIASGYKSATQKPGLRHLAKGHRGLRYAGEEMEDWLRLGHFIGALEKSGTTDILKATKYAAEEVRKFHFDYTDFSDFEKMYMLRAFPFYKWTRKALPLMATTLFTKPGKALAYPKVANAASNYLTTGDIMEDENGFAPTFEGIVPDFIQDMWAYQIAVNEDNNPVWFNLQNPTSDAMRTVNNPLGQAYSMANPLVKIPLEQLMPGGIATDDQGSGFGSTVGGLPGVGGFNKDLSDPGESRERLAHAVSPIPAAKFGLEALGITNEGEGISSERGMSFGTGVGVYEVDDPIRWGTLFGRGYEYNDAVREINKEKNRLEP